MYLLHFTLWEFFLKRGFTVATKTGLPESAIQKIQNQITSSAIKKSLKITPITKKTKPKLVDSTKIKPKIKWKTLLELLEHRALKQPNDNAYTFLTDGENNEEKLTYKELYDKAISLAIELQKHNLQGERILLLFNPGLDFIISFFACIAAGSIAIPAYPPKLNRNMVRLQTIAEDAQAKLALTTHQIHQSVDNKLQDTPILEQIQWLASDTIPNNSPSNWQRPVLYDDSIAFLQYTSGSTSAPKGVMVTHENILYNEEMIKHGFGHGKKEVVVGWLPVFHDMGLIGNVLQPIYIGAPSIFMAPNSFLQKPIRWLKTITKHKATTSGGPNFAYDLCAQKITAEQKEELDLSSWKLAFCGAEPINPETAENFYQAFKSCGYKKESFYPCYGLAETTLFVTGGHKSSAPVIQKVDSTAFERNRIEKATKNSKKTQTLVGCGRTWLDQKIKIVDPATLTESPLNWVGEIWIQGPNVTRGYWNKFELTMDTFNAHFVDTKDGPYLRTGDLGFLREDGELFITGRIKELIILNGRNYYPQDIELTVEKTCADIRQHGTAAFSIKKDNKEKLIVVAELERTSLRKFDSKKVNSKIVKAISRHHELPLAAIVYIKTGTLPMTSSGKIQRNRCQHMYLNNELNIVAQWDNSQVLHIDPKDEKKIKLPSTDTEVALVKMYKKLLNTKSISIEDDLLGVGGDSIMATQALSRIEEKFNVTLTFQELFETATIELLGHTIEDKQTQTITDIDNSLLESLLAEVETNETAEKTLAHA